MKKILCLAFSLSTLCCGIVLTGHSWGDEGVEKWTFQTGSKVLSSPAVGADGTIYVGSDDSHLYAIRPDGTQKWAFKTGGSVIYAPSVASDGTIYAGSSDGKVYAINEEGGLKWAFQTGDALHSSPVIGPDNTIYVASWDYRIYALNPDGTQQWVFETGEGLFSAPAIGPDGAIYICSSDGKLYAILGGEKSTPARADQVKMEMATPVTDVGGVVEEASTEMITLYGPEREEIKDTLETNVYQRPIEGTPETGASGQGSSVREDDIPSVTQQQFMEIRDIRFEAEDDGEERVVFLLNAIYAPKVLTVAQAWPRVICDFAGVRLAQGLEGETRVHGAVIQRIRTSLYGPSGSGVKVVLDMHPDRSDLLEGPFFDEEYVYASGEEYLYMLTFKPDQLRQTKSQSEKGLADVSEAALKDREF